MEKQKTKIVENVKAIGTLEEFTDETHRNQVYFFLFILFRLEKELSIFKKGKKEMT